MSYEQLYRYQHDQQLQDADRVRLQADMAQNTPVTPQGQATQYAAQYEARKNAGLAPDVQGQRNYENWVRQNAIAQQGLMSLEALKNTGDIDKQYAQNQGLMGLEGLRNSGALQQLQETDRLKRTPQDLYNRAMIGIMEGDERPFREWQDSLVKGAPKQSARGTAPGRGQGLAPWNGGNQDYTIGKDRNGNPLITNEGIPHSSRNGLTVGNPADLGDGRMDLFDRSPSLAAARNDSQYTKQGLMEAVGGKPFSANPYDYKDYDPNTGYFNNGTMHDLMGRPRGLTGTPNAVQQQRPTPEALQFMPGSDKVMFGGAEYSRQGLMEAMKPFAPGGQQREGQGRYRVIMQKSKDGFGNVTEVPMMYDAWNGKWVDGKSGVGEIGGEGKIPPPPPSVNNPGARPQQQGAGAPGGTETQALSVGGANVGSSSQQQPGSLYRTNSYLLQNANNSPVGLRGAGTESDLWREYEQPFLKAMPPAPVSPGLHSNPYSVPPITKSPALKYMDPNIYNRAIGALQTMPPVAGLTGNLDETRKRLESRGAIGPQISIQGNPGLPGNGEVSVSPLNPRGALPGGGGLTGTPPPPVGPRSGLTTGDPGNQASGLSSASQARYGLTVGRPGVPKLVSSGGLSIVNKYYHEARRHAGLMSAYS